MNQILPTSNINPYERLPLPKPLKGSGWRASEICRHGVLADLVEENAAWLQSRPRTTNQIHAALLPAYDLCGMQSDEVYQLLNCALWAADYKAKPGGGSRNPTWTWQEGA